MKKITFLLCLFILCIACGVKTTRNLLTSGDYDAAINRAIEGLQGNKNAKGKQDYVYLLEESFAKAKERDLREIETWKSDGNPQYFEKIYSTYKKLSNRQEQVRPLLPLHYLVENRDALFPMEDYTSNINDSKNNLSKYLYDNSKALLASKDKLTIRRAYDDLHYLNEINANYKDVNSLMSEALQKGTDFVNVYTKNETNLIIPIRLQNDLLDFSTFGLNDKWTIYHNNKQKGINYDYGMIVNFREINISPEQVKEREFTNEKQIKDGTKPLLNAQGQQVIDNTGHVVMIDNIKTIRAQIYESKQFKSCQVVAKVDYIDFKTNQLIDTFPISSEFIFQNIYSRYNGERLACDANYLSYFDKRQVPFPNNDQMVFDAGRDVKNKLKNIISGNRIRR